MGKTRKLTDGRESAPLQPGGGIYTPELATRVLDELIKGRTLNSIGRDPGMPHSATIRLWARDDVEGFRERYNEARRLQMEYWADDIVEISDDNSRDVIETERGEVQNGEFIQRSRVRIDTRKWLLSKLRPEQYGDSVKLGGDAANPLQVIVKRYSEEKDE